jgi:peptidoglycan-associated lipoprotein
MILVTVHFDFDQFNIRSSDRPLLEAAAKVMAADPSIRVVAVGHCDHFGSEQYNLALGDRRANTVKGYLINNGAGSDQTEILSRGKFGAVPDVSKQSPEAQNDRRVDVVKIPAGVTVPSGPPPSSTTPVTATTPQ